MHSQQASAPKNARLEALMAKHKSLSKKIEQKQIIPSVSDLEIGGLKREKLKIKEEIEGIRKVS